MDCMGLECCAIKRIFQDPREELLEPEPRIIEGEDCNVSCIEGTSVKQSQTKVIEIDRINIDFVNNEQIDIDSSTSIFASLRLILMDTQISLCSFQKMDGVRINLTT